MKLLFENSLNALERRWGRYAVPSLVRYLAIALFGVYILGFAAPNLGALLNFDGQKTLEGEYWRPFTFIFAVSAGKPTAIGVIFAYFGMMLMCMFGDGLEQQWGVFRSNLYVLWGWLSAVLASVAIYFLGAETHSAPGIYLGMSILFAFATYNPKFTIMLMMVIPTPIWLIATVTGIGVSISMLAGASQAIFTLICLSNFLLVALPVHFTNARHRSQTHIRRKKFQSSDDSGNEAFNTCAVCGATEITHSDHEFRVGDDGQDYCLEHLPES